MFTFSGFISRMFRRAQEPLVNHLKHMPKKYATLNYVTLTVFYRLAHGSALLFSVLFVYKQGKNADEE